MHGAPVRWTVSSGRIFISKISCNSLQRFLNSSGQRFLLWSWCCWLGYLTVQTKRRVTKPFERICFYRFCCCWSWIIPGCLGNFIIVALFAHRLKFFCPGCRIWLHHPCDEAFIMLAMMPSNGTLFIPCTVLHFNRCGADLNLFPLGRSKMYLPGQSFRTSIYRILNVPVWTFTDSAAIKTIFHLNVQSCWRRGILFTILILSGDWDLKNGTGEIIFPVCCTCWGIHISNLYLIIFW